VTRFDKFRQRLGISRNVLNERLAYLLSGPGDLDSIVRAACADQGSGI
jgi:hypothetical protein